MCVVCDVVCGCVWLHMLLCVDVRGCMPLCVVLGGFVCVCGCVFVQLCLVLCVVFVVVCGCE